jgi:hypothetical protein
MEKSLLALEVERGRDSLNKLTQVSSHKFFNLLTLAFLNADLDRPDVVSEKDIIQYSGFVTFWILGTVPLTKGSGCGSKSLRTLRMRKKSIYFIFFYVFK